MPDAQVRDEVMTLFLAGHETTALSLVWTLSLLAQNPWWNAASRRELVGFSATRALCRTRRRGEGVPAPLSAGVGRQPGRGRGRFDRRLHAAKGTSVILSPGSRSERGFFADPAFRPERWQTGRRRSPGWPTFRSAGPRSCIGAGFAAMELKTILATLLSKVRFVAIPGRTSRPSRRSPFGQEGASGPS
jgi:cytochrome P450